LTTDKGISQSQAARDSQGGAQSPHVTMCVTVNVDVEYSHNTYV